MPEVVKGSTSKSITFRVASSSTGLPMEDLVASNFAIQYEIDNGAKVTISLVDLLSLTAAWASGGIFYRGDGKYRLDVPDTVWATVGKTIVFFATITDGVAYFHDYLVVPPYTNGLGDTPCIMEILDGADPVEDARVWITTDANGTNIVAGSAYTDEFGKVPFFLGSGTYYRWASKTGVEFDNPQDFTVT